MRLAFSLSLCALLAVSPVLADPSTNAATVFSVVAPAADTCGWSAQMEEDEGGSVMVASSCESDTETGPAFRLLCGNIRYNGSGLGMGANPPASSTLVLTSGGKSLTAEVLFEEMDGAFAAYVELGSPIISLLKTGNEVGVTLKGTDLPSRMVSLKGSTAAIDKLIHACK
ncbi:MAG: hypothetical protein JWP26_2147 [Devosia sp.]|uniref:hypothetical protein n=1 Tax=Devosia sp. TaxID=1871048 RepID=UPI002604066F|nr:hypothetical protein [Devosia sp.]MDB5587177.1 hypothetical protein [Devosia sp.]